MSAKLLRSAPMSGEFREYYFGKPSGLWIWVLFEDNDFDNWYGCFAGAACYGYNEVLVDKENNTAIVIAARTCYIIDISKRKLLWEPDPFLSVSGIIQSSDPDYYIITDRSFLYIFTTGGEFVKKIIPSFSGDGLYLSHQKEKELFIDIYIHANTKRNRIRLDLKELILINENQEND